MYGKFRTFKELMEDMNETEGSVHVTVREDRSVCSLDGMIRKNYGLRATGRRLEIVDDDGCFCGGFNGYAPLSGGNVVYM